MDYAAPIQTVDCVKRLSPGRLPIILLDQPWGRGNING